LGISPSWKIKKHIYPDIKHHRDPASHISFSAANLPFLIKETEDEFFAK